MEPRPDLDRDGLIRGNPEGWGSTTIVASLAGPAALLLAFLAVEGPASSSPVSASA